MTFYFWFYFALACVGCYGVWAIVDAILDWNAARVIESRRADVLERVEPISEERQRQVLDALARTGIGPVSRG